MVAELAVSITGTMMASYNVGIAHEPAVSTETSVGIMMASGHSGEIVEPAVSMQTLAGITIMITSGIAAEPVVLSNSGHSGMAAVKLTVSIEKSDDIIMASGDFGSGHSDMAAVELAVSLRDIHWQPYGFWRFRLEIFWLLLNQRFQW